MATRWAFATLPLFLIGCSAAHHTAEVTPTAVPPAVPTAVAAPEKSPSPVASPPAGLVAPEPTRFYRGDWEPPNVLLVAYDEDWPEELGALIDSAHHEVDVYVVAGADELADPVFLSWLSSHRAGVLPASHDTPWIRDYGPQQVIEPNGEVKWLDFRYSEERPFDDLVPIELAPRLGANVEPQTFWLDGGALISNGSGLCAMTDTSLSEMGIDEEDDEQFDRFLVTVGCDVMAVLPALPREETGHADVIAQFLSETVVAIGEADPATPADVAGALDEAVTTLDEAALAFGQSLSVIRLPLAARGDRFYSYVNGTRLPMRYLVPRFQTTPELERIVHRRLRAALPDVTLVPILADSMVERGGALHCITLGLSTRPLPG